VLIGGSLAGLLGMLIAIPAAACLRIVSSEVVLPKLRQWAASS
jgi:predicted PurR-regulated permease PerM